DAADSTVYSRALAPGALKANVTRTSFTFRDPRTAAPGRIQKLSVHRRKRTASWTTQLRVSDIALGATPPPVTSTAAPPTIRASAFTGDLTCTPNRKATVTTCVR